MATRFVLTAGSAEFPSANAPQPVAVGSAERRMGLAFDASTEESCAWTLVAPAGWTGTITAVITYVMASATSGGVAWGVSLEAVTDGDATDLDAGTDYDTENVATVASVPGTAGYIDQVSVTLTTNDASAAADLLRLRLARKTANAADTAAGDAYVLAVTLSDAA
jgi:hypothetical protein